MRAGVDCHVSRPLMAKSRYKLKDVRGAGGPEAADIIASEPPTARTSHTQARTHAGTHARTHARTHACRHAGMSAMLAFLASSLRAVSLVEHVTLHVPLSLSRAPCSSSSLSLIATRTAVNRAPSSRGAAHVRLNACNVRAYMRAGTRAREGGVTWRTPNPDTCGHARAGRKWRHQGRIIIDSSTLLERCSRHAWCCGPGNSIELFSD